MLAPTPEEFMDTDTLKAVKARGGWRVGERSGLGENPPRVTIGTAEDERGEN